MRGPAVGACGRGKSLESVPDAFVGQRLVPLNQHRRAHDIGVEDNSELAGGRIRH